MGGVVSKASGASYLFGGNAEEAAREYERFLGCLLQLTDDTTDVGNVEGRWVIFQSGWVYGLSSYKTYSDAVSFASQMFRDEPDANYIIVEVDPNKHAVTAMHLLASALSDVDSASLRKGKSTHPEVPDEEPASES